MCSVYSSHCYLKVIALNETGLQRIDDDFHEVENFIDRTYFNKSNEDHFRVHKHLNKTRSNKKSKNKNRAKNKNREFSNKKKDLPPDIQIETLPFQFDQVDNLLSNATLNNSDILPLSSGSVKTQTMQNDQLLNSDLYSESEQYREREDEKIGTASLTFVFDSTGSMWDDLKQVKIGAAKILESMLERYNKPIYNFVLVPFRDPGRFNSFHEAMFPFFFHSFFFFLISTHAFVTFSCS